MTDGTTGGGRTTAPLPSPEPTGARGAVEAIPPPPDGRTTTDGDGRTTTDGDGRRGDAIAPPLAPGVELLGVYQGSAFKEPPLMIRRGDGRLIQLAPLLYALAQRLDGGRTYPELSAELGEALRRGVEPDDVRFLVEQKLAPLGIVGGGGPAQPRAADPLLALKLRTAVVPASVVRGLTTAFRPAFLPPVVVAVIAGFVAVDVWLFGVHGIAQSLRSTLHQPLTLLLLFGLVVLAAAFHEAGHATGCRHGGAEPGEMGVGIYVVWPAFYTDISDSHRLPRAGRLRADLGGVYFHAIFILAVLGIHVLTGNEALLLVLVVLQLEMVRQMVPLLRFDGYYVLSDLIGVPDLFARLKPILVSLLPWRRADAKVRELKPWARFVVTAWVLTVVLVLGWYVVTLAIATPRLIATAWDSFWNHVDRTRTAVADGATAAAALGSVQVLTLLLPVAGIAYTSVKLVRGLGRTWVRLSRRPVMRAAFAALVVAVVAALASLWLPSEAYRPIGPTERWTVGETVSAISSIPDGSAASSLSDADGTRAEGSGGSGPVGSAGNTATQTEGLTTSPTPTATATPTPSATTSPTVSPSASTTTSPSPTAATAGTPTPSASPTATASPSR